MSAMRPEDIPHDVIVQCQSEKWGGCAEYVSQSPAPTVVGCIKWVAGDPGKPMIVGNVKAVTHGWGPMLYDVAMECAGQRGLMSDRFNVTEEARQVWQFYDTQRQDVSKQQMDNMGHYFSASDTLAVEQSSARKDPTAKKWYASSLSRAYFAMGTPTLERLQELGKLRKVA